MNKPLTPKQEAFCREYLIDLNASQAAVRAGYRGDPNTVGPRLLANVGVRSLIEKLKEDRSDRTQVNADWVLKRLEQDASADIADLYDETGQLKPVKEWPLAFRTGLVAGVDTVQERDGQDSEGRPEYVTVRKIKLADRAKYLEMIGRHIGVGAFKDKLEVDVVDSLAARLERVRAKRAAK